MKTKVAFRADGSNILGLGHIYNSLAVAEALRIFPVEIYFTTKNIPESVIKLQQAGYPVETIEATLGEADSFKKTIKILKEKEISILVTDLIEIKNDYSSEFQKEGIKCISLDILGKIALKSNIIINRTTLEKRFKNYDKTGNTKYYLGPKYVPLRKEFQDLNKFSRQINPKVQQVLLCFGGGDEFNLSARVAWILRKFNGIKMTIALGAAFKLEEELQEIISQLPEKPTVIKDATNMKQLFQQSDLAICAGGSILYELAITGTPALVIPMNDHQVENAEEFARLGSVISVGLHTETEDQDIENALKDLLEHQHREKMSVAGKRITDGRGAERIAEIIYDFSKESKDNTNNQELSE